NAATLRLARAFGAPFIIHARLRDGSLRQAATELGATVLVYEAGQAHRFDDEAIETGVVGVMRTLKSLRMIDIRLPRVGQTRVMRRTRWVRARRGGLANISVDLGDEVERGDVVATISDAFSTRPTASTSPSNGFVVARTLRPLVNSGDALVHIASEQGPYLDEPAERRR
ncbi:MAG TPA: succinylglutamate desuccinylase/aspartoacylase family protein, partial [Acidimicrobiia bacterium]|nr:succinylglutamate desuccinylase/aspartoacylase family protein [Acidimicrobiia bacterium]